MEPREALYWEMGHVLFCYHTLLRLALEWDSQFGKIVVFIYTGQLQDLYGFMKTKAEKLNMPYMVSDANMYELLYSSAVVT